MQKTYDLNIVENRPLINPALLHSELPIDENTAKLVTMTRDRIRKILRNLDRRLLVVVGPCSIHDVNAAYEYGTKLASLRQELAEELEIIMRVYFEKPRTRIGWKGLINDPHLNNSYDINTGLRLARKLLLDLAHLGVPAATELLDPITPQYIADLVSWTAIGARTIESQPHREMASGLSMPVGFKNATNGSLKPAIDAMVSASRPHHFLGINHHGLASIVATAGNADGHLVLRGGSDGSNYHPDRVEEAAKKLASHGLMTRIMVDCSHGNSNKDHTKQPRVLEDFAAQIENGSQYLMGLMIESHLVAGNQPIPEDLDRLVYGQSITDACVDFETTATMLRSLAKSARSRLLLNR